MKYLTLLVLVSFFLSGKSYGKSIAKKSYYFDKNGISREVLENYLDRSVTMGYFLIPSKPEGSKTYLFHDDEISWFSLQPEKYSNHWLEYAHQWVKQTDPNGQLQMPVSRMITCPNKTQGSYRANTQSSSCSIGYSQEKTIKKIWKNE